MTCKLQVIELPKKIDWGRQKSLALHAWLFFDLEGVFDAFFSILFFFLTVGGTVVRWGGLAGEFSDLKAGAAAPLISLFLNVK